MNEPDEALRATFADPALDANVSGATLLTGVRDRRDRLIRRRRTATVVASVAVVVAVLGGVGLLVGRPPSPTVAPAGPGAAPVSAPLTPAPLTPAPLTATPLTPPALTPPPALTAGPEPVPITGPATAAPLPRTTSPEATVAEPGLSTSVATVPPVTSPG